MAPDRGVQNTIRNVDSSEPEAAEDARQPTISYFLFSIFYETNSAEPRIRSRPGVSLLELLIALTLTGVLGTIMVTTFIGTHRFARRHAERVAATEASRVAAAVLTREVRYLVPNTDIYGWGRDSVALRAFRGTAIVCAANENTILVRYRGLRAPEPTKDSVTTVGTTIRGPGGVPHGTSFALLASTVTAAGCETAPGESLLRWTLDPKPPRGSLLLLFESGSYHLSSGALRYRRGDAGRQPLTAELFDDRAVAIQWTSGTDAAGATGAAEGGPLSDLTGSVAGLALRLATKPTSPDKLPVLPAIRHWIRLPNGDLW